MSLRSIVLLAALLHAAPAMAGLLPSNEKATTLLNQAQALEAEGKGNEALQRFREAALADPTASSPLSHIAYMFYGASVAAPAKDAVELRQQAAAHANAALKLDERDPIAMEVLRALADGQPQVRHEPTPAARKAVNEGELLFNEKKFAAAMEKYQQAAQLDPAYAEAVLLMGDCYFMQGDMPNAEATFRKATQIDPFDATAWRFLFDAQIRQGKAKDANASAISAVAAMPSARQNWVRINQWMGQWGTQLSPFRLVPRVTVSGTTVNMDADIPPSDHLTWLAYGVALAAAPRQLPDGSPFERDLYAWEKAMQVAQGPGQADQLKDEGLRAMLRFHKAGQLKAAVFLLLYREAYRPQFEAWKKANPDAIKGFIDTFQVGL